MRRLPLTIYPTKSIMNEYTGKAERLLRLISIFQLRRNLTAREIMQELSISRRSVFRYTNSLSQLGFPVYYDSYLKKHVLLDTGSSKLGHITESESEFITEVIQQAAVNMNTAYQERIKTILTKLNVKYKPLQEDSHLDRTEGINLAHILTALERHKTLIITTQDDKQYRIERAALVHEEEWQLIDRSKSKRESHPINEISTVSVTQSSRRNALRR